MNKLLYLLLFCLIINLGCNKDPNILFDFKYDQNITIPAGLSYLDTHYFRFNDVQTNYKTLLQAHGYTAAQIKQIEPGSAFILSLDNGNMFDFIQEISIKISSTDTFIKEAFYTIEVPLNASDRLDMVGTLVELKDILDQDRFNIEVGFKLRANSPSTIDARFTMKFLAK
ncbi:MAG TPA: hypothetical protein VK590_12795 [Saprospiraceae bacterium]|nr:hypothetical protein [Saprospiraceae bacterium]